MDLLDLDEVQGDVAELQQLQQDPGDALARFQQQHGFTATKNNNNNADPENSDGQGSDNNKDNNNDDNNDNNKTSNNKDNSSGSGTKGDNDTNPKQFVAKNKTDEAQAQPRPSTSSQQRTNNKSNKKGTQPFPHDSTQSLKSGDVERHHSIEMGESDSAVAVAASAGSEDDQRRSSSDGAAAPKKQRRRRWTLLPRTHHPDDVHSVEPPHRMAMTDRVLLWMCYFMATYTAAALAGVIAAQTKATPENNWPPELVIMNAMSQQLSLLLLAFIICFSPTAGPIRLVGAVFFCAGITNITLQSYFYVRASGIDVATTMVDAASIAMGLATVVLAGRIVRDLKEAAGRMPTLKNAFPMFKYWLLLVVPEIIAAINAVVNNGSNNSFSPVSIYFAAYAGLFLVLLRLKFAQHKQTTTIFQLLGVMKRQEFLPFAVLSLMLVHFGINYVAQFSATSWFTTYIGTVASANIIFGVLALIVCIQIAQLVLQWRWLSWIA